MLYPYIKIYTLKVQHTSNQEMNTPIPQASEGGVHLKGGGGGRIPPAMFFGLWELDMTMMGAEIFIRWTISIDKLVNWEKIPKKYQGVMPLSLKVNTLELPIQQWAKGQKFKNCSNLPVFNVTGLRFCTPPIVHKNEQLLFLDQKI